MKLFIITITVQIPYPREFTYRITATSVATATARALRMLRKDIPRKKIETYKILIGCGNSID